MVALTLFVARTKIGKAMRATSFDREAASMMGIDVDRVIASTFFIGSALAGAAGVMFGLVFGQIFHYMGFLAGLKGFTAAVIGGIGSIPGAMIGGLLVGLAEAYPTGYLPQGSTFQDLYVFALLILIILIKPSGISASRREESPDDGGRALLAFEQPDQPRIGVDEWVASVEGKRRSLQRCHRSPPPPMEALPVGGGCSCSHSPPRSFRS